MIMIIEVVLIVIIESVVLEVVHVVHSSPHPSPTRCRSHRRRRYRFHHFVIFQGPPATLFFDTSAVLMTFMLLGKLLEQLARGKASNAVSTLRVRLMFESLYHGHVRRGQYAGRGVAGSKRSMLVAEAFKTMTVLCL